MVLAFPQKGVYALAPVPVVQVEPEHYNCANVKKNQRLLTKDY